MLGTTTLAALRAGRRERSHGHGGAKEDVHAVGGGRQTFTCRMLPSDTRPDHRAVPCVEVIAAPSGGKTTTARAVIVARLLETVTQAEWVAAVVGAPGAAAAAPAVPGGGGGEAGQSSSAAALYLRGEVNTLVWRRSPSGSLSLVHTAPAVASVAGGGGQEPPLARKALVWDTDGKLCPRVLAEELTCAAVRVAVRGCCTPSSVGDGCDHDALAHRWAGWARSQGISLPMPQPAAVRMGRLIARSAWSRLVLRRPPTSYALVRCVRAITSMLSGPGAGAPALPCCVVWDAATAVWCCDRGIPTDPGAGIAVRAADLPPPTRAGHVPLQSPEAALADLVATMRTAARRGFLRPVMRGVGGAAAPGPVEPVTVVLLSQGLLFPREGLLAALAPSRLPPEAPWLTGCVCEAALGHSCARAMWSTTDGGLRGNRGLPHIPPTAPVAGRLVDGSIPALQPVLAALVTTVLVTVRCAAGVAPDGRTARTGVAVLEWQGGAAAGASVGAAVRSAPARQLNPAALVRLGTLSLQHR